MKDSRFDVGRLGWPDWILASLFFAVCISTLIDSEGAKAVMRGEIVLLTSFAGLLVCGVPLLFWTGPRSVYWKGGLALVAVLLLGALASFLLVWSGLGEGSAPIILEGDLVSAFIALVVLVPLAEEILFRGVLYGGLKSWFRSGLVAAFVSSLGFAIAHGDLMSWPHHFLLGLLLCWSLERSGSLWSSVSIHALNNAFAFLVVIGR